MLDFLSHERQGDEFLGFHVRNLQRDSTSSREVEQQKHHKNSGTGNFHRSQERSGRADQLASQYLEVEVRVLSQHSEPSREKCGKGNKMYI